jgi:HK97 gp10 family phage protein
MSVVLKSSLGDISSGIPDEVKDAIKEQADQIAEAARQKVPVRTGKLRDSIEVIDYNEPGFVGYRIVAEARAEGGRYNAPYAHMVEYGSVHNKPAQPFMLPALEEGRDPTLKAVSDALDKLGES